MKRKTSDSSDNMPLCSLKTDANSYSSLCQRVWERCDLCDEVFNTRFANIKHNATHIIIPLLKLTLHQCEECLFHFSSLEDLHNHTITKNHKTSQITSSQKVGYEHMLQSIIEKQAVVRCQDSLKYLNPKSETEAILKDAMSECEVKIKKEIPVFEISSDTDRDSPEPKQNEKETNHKEIKKDRTSTFNDDFDSSQLKEPSSPLERISSRIMFEDDYDDDDDLFEAEEILPDKPYYPPKNSFIIGNNPSTHISHTNSNKAKHTNSYGHNNSNKMSHTNSNYMSHTNSNNISHTNPNGHKNSNTMSHPKSNTMSHTNSNNMSHTNSNNISHTNSNNISHTNSSHINLLTRLTNSDSMSPGPNKLSQADLILLSETSNIIPVKARNGIKSYVPPSVHYNDLIEPNICDCRYCGRCFINQFELIIHETTHMQATPARPILCYVCEKYLSGNHWTLRRHLQNFHPTQERKLPVHKCLICHFKYHNYPKHVRLYHMVTCKVCGVRFNRTKWNLHECSQIEHDINEKVIKMCEMCVTFTKNKQNVRYEVIGEYSEVGSRQQCDKCLAMYFEVNLVKRKMKEMKAREERDCKKKKPMSNEERLKKMRNRLKMVNKMNKC